MSKTIRYVECAHCGEVVGTYYVTCPYCGYRLAVQSQPPREKCTD
jgi:DNA-directed RNA polymerase subunit RPC12/RpoP